MALAAIEQVKKHHCIPIISGGTGLYIRSLISPLDHLPSADLLLRTSLSTLSTEALLARLRELDPTALELIDHKNRRRIQRAVEIITQSGSPLHEVWRKQKETLPPTLGFFLFREREELYQRIERNINNMFEQGVVEEVMALNATVLSPTASMALGLREIQAYLCGTISLDSTIKTIIQSTRRYAKRQITWFKNQHSFFPLNLSDFSSMEEAVDQAITFCHAETRHE